MTDREKILEILKKAEIIPDYIKIENISLGKNITFNFSETGELLSIQL